MATRARGRAAAPPPQGTAAILPAAATFGVVAGAVALWFGYPGFLALWFALLVASWLVPRPVLTGTDAAKNPIPAGPAEQRADNAYRLAASLRWSLSLPTTLGRVGVPWPYAAWAWSVVAAVTAWGLPHHDLPAQYPAQLLNLADGLFAMWLVNAVAAMRRDTVITDDRSPGVRFDTIGETFAQNRYLLAAVPGAALVVAFLAYFMLPVTPLGAWPWIPVGLLAGAGAVVSPPWTQVALAQWRRNAAARAEWAPRWTMLKHNDAPVLLNRETVGQGTDDHFRAHGSMGSATYLALGPKITQAIGGAVRIALLPVPSKDSSGQPIPGTIDPLEFRIVSWPNDYRPSLAEPGLEAAEAELLLQCGIAWACEQWGGFPIIDRMDLISTDPGGDVPDQAPDGDAVGDDGQGGPPEEPPAPPGPSTLVWRVSLFEANGPRWSDLRKMLAGAIGAEVGAECLVDHRAPCMYVGALTSDVPELRPDAGVDACDLEWLSIEDEWNAAWGASMKNDVNPPTPNRPTYAERHLADGKTIFRLAFVPRTSMPYEDFFGLEPKLRSTKNPPPPFMAITGWTSHGRIGERHPTAFTLYWSPDMVPSSPDSLAPPQPPRGPRARMVRNEDMSGEAQQWVLIGLLNDGFRAARLALPQLHDARCLTDPRSPKHIWEMQVRLYGGVTFDEVAKAAQKIRQAWGTEWLRVAPAEDGCVIVAGAAPKRARISSERNARYLQDLDWRQAFQTVKAIGEGGLTPSINGSERLPDNERVEVLDCTLPPGISLGTLRALRAKLEAASSHAFVEPRAHPDQNPAHVLLYVCETNPMPERVDYDWEYPVEPASAPFATGVEGSPIALDFKAEPHCLIAGTSGGGKSSAAQCIIFGVLRSGMRVVVVDAQKQAADFRFAEKHLYGIATDLFEAEATMKAIYAETKRRADLNGKHGVGHVRDLPPELVPPPILVFLDEFLGLIMTGAKPSTKTEEDPELEKARLEEVRNYEARKQIGFIAGRIAAEARSADIHIVLATQKLATNSIPENMRDIKTNMARILLGKATFGEKMSALRDAESAPPLGEHVPRGRGIWESTLAPAVAAQFWFATPDAYAEHLNTVPVPPERLDITPFVREVTVNPEDVFGAVIEDEGSSAGTDDVTESVIEAPVFSLDDLEALTDDDATDEEDELPEWARAAAEALSEDGRADSPASDDEDEPRAPDAAAPRTEEVHEDEPVLTPLPADTPGDTETDTQADAEPDSGADIGTSPTDDEETIPVKDRIDWSEIDPAPWTPAESDYGWAEVDALVGFLHDFAEVTDVDWNDPLLLEPCDMGITWAELIVELLEPFGVTLHGPGEPPQPEDDLFPATVVSADLAGGPNPFAPGGS